MSLSSWGASWLHGARVEDGKKDKKGGVVIWASPGGTSSKEPACQCRRRKKPGFDPWVGKMPWRRAWQPTPVFLPGESHGQRSLVGCSPWGREESDMTERRSAVEECRRRNRPSPLVPVSLLPLDSWPSSSIWRRPGPRRDSCLGTQRRGRRCAWCPTSSPVASSPCRCSSCVCALPPSPRSFEPTLGTQLVSGWGLGAGGQRGPSGTWPWIVGQREEGSQKIPIPRGPPAFQGHLQRHHLPLRWEGARRQGEVSHPGPALTQSSLPFTCSLS